ncbi:MAG: acyl carrier protein [Methylotenera sp.]|nr:acyl carrier protein [Methylotenera sp.]
MTTINRLRAMLVKDYKLDADKLTEDARLEDLGIDSLGMAELLFNLEDEFGLTLSDDAATLTTFGDVVRFIDKLIAARDTPAGSSMVGSTQEAP